MRLNWHEGRRCKMSRAAGQLEHQGGEQDAGRPSHTSVVASFSVCAEQLHLSKKGSSALARKQEMIWIDRRSVEECQGWRF